jgi:hypothetical protein
MIPENWSDAPRSDNVLSRVIVDLFSKIGFPKPSFVTVLCWVMNSRNNQRNLRLELDVKYVLILFGP